MTPEQQRTLDRIFDVSPDGMGYPFDVLPSGTILVYLPNRNPTEPPNIRTILTNGEVV